MTQEQKEKNALYKAFNFKLSKLEIRIFEYFSTGRKPPVEMLYKYDNMVNKYKNTFPRQRIF